MTLSVPTVEKMHLTYVATTSLKVMNCVITCLMSQMMSYMAKDNMILVLCDHGMVFPKDHPTTINI